MFGIGLEAYWLQLRGLKASVELYLDQVAKKLVPPGIEIVNLGLIDAPPKAFEAGHRFRREDVDLIFIHVTTYALSATVLPVMKRAKVPVGLPNLAPEPPMNSGKFNPLNDRPLMTAETLPNSRPARFPRL